MGAGDGRGKRERHVGSTTTWPVGQRRLPFWSSSWSMDLTHAPSAWVCPRTHYMCCYQEKRWGFAGAALGWGGLVPRGTVCKALTYSSKSFSFKPDSAGSLHKPLSFHSPEIGRRSKNYTPTAARMKTIPQKVNQNEKVETYVLDEGTR